jgi:hypothetical protein
MTVASDVAGRRVVLAARLALGSQRGTAMTRQPEESRDSKDSDGDPTVYKYGLESADTRDLGVFGRMFQGEAFVRPRCLLEELARQMTENVDNPDTSFGSGYTVLSQFITHDLTFDRTPLVPADGPIVTTNFRTARFDLDTVYGPDPSLPNGPPRDRDNDKLATKFSTTRVAPDDLPRVPRGQPDQNQARIPDRRNDENVLVAQLHLAFLKLHNVFVDQIRREGKVSKERVFDAARLRCQWYYQWLVVNDFLPRIVGQDMVNELLTLRLGKPAEFHLRFYRPGNPLAPMMPLEFAAAAFRFGHSLIRPEYRVATAGVGVNLFGSSGAGGLEGFRAIPDMLEIEWRRFFLELPPPRGTDPDDFNRRRNHAKKIDAHLTPPLGNVPDRLLPPGESAPRINSLPLRELLRGQRHQLPSGQCVARAIKCELGTGVVLTNEQLGLDRRWGDEAPLWFYVLKEAQCAPRQDDGVRGEQLGPVGGRIVAEVILGLLQADETSYLRADPDFAPTPVTCGTLGGPFRMAHLMCLAGVVKDLHAEVAVKGGSEPGT